MHLWVSAACQPIELNALQRAHRFGAGLTDSTATDPANIDYGCPKKVLYQMSAAATQTAPHRVCSFCRTVKLIRKTVFTLWTTRNI